MMRIAWTTILLLTVTLPALPAAAQCIIYQIDGGVLGGGAGPNPGWSFIALNNFTVAGGENVIGVVEVCFYNHEIEQIVTAAVWSDPNQDGEPFDGVLLGTSAATASMIGCQRLSLSTPVDVGPDGSSFFMGVYYETAPGTGLVVQGDSSSGAGWLFEEPGPPDPNDLTGMVPHPGVQVFFIRAVLPLCAAITDLIQAVEGCVSDGDLMAGHGRALTNKLNSALKKFEKGNTAAAADKVQAFIDQVINLEADGHIASDKADELTGAAQAILDVLQGP